MAELMEREIDALSCVRAVVLRNGGAPAHAMDVCFEANRRWMTGDSRTLRGLSGLIPKGLLSKPRRGYYLPTHNERTRRDERY
jgi:hypothetical protein